MGRHRSKSTGPRTIWSLSLEECSDVNDDGELYPPSSGSICLATAKNGRSAFGRKKESMSRDFGFDALGYIFGMPSPKDLDSDTERQVRRRKSLSSQSRTLTLTAPSSSSYTFTIRRRPSQRSYSLSRSFSPVAVRQSSRKSSPCSASTTTSKSSLQSSSTSTPVCSCHCCGSQRSTSHHSHLSQGRDEPLLSGNSLPATPNGPISPPLGSQGCIVQSPTTGGVLLLSPLAPTTPSHHYVPTPAFLVPQPPSVPLYVQQSPTTVQQPGILPPNYPSSGPVPVPLPTSSFANQQFPLVQARSDGHIGASNKPVKFSLTEASKCEEHYNTALRAETKDINNKKSEVEHKKENEAGNQRSVSKHIQHIHHCAGCGRLRSKEYQKAHPLKRGQIPEPEYCTRCLRDAALMENAAINEASAAQSANEGSVSTTNTAVPHTRKKESKRHGTFAWLKSKRPRRFSFLSSLLSNSTTSECSPRSPTSVSSTGETGSNISAPVMGSSRENRNNRPISSLRDDFDKADSKAPPSKPDRPRRSQRVDHSEDKGSVVKNYIRAASLSTALNSSREKLTGTAQVRPQNGSRGDIYNSTPLNVPTNGRRSKTSQPHFPKSSTDDKPKAFVQSVSDFSEEAQSPNYRIRDETPQAVDDDHSITNSANEVPKGSGPKAHDRNTRPKKPNRRVHDRPSTYGSTHENRPKVRIHEQQETAARTIAGPEQSVLDLEPGGRGNSDRGRVRRHRDRTGTRHGAARDSDTDRAINAEQDVPDNPNRAPEGDLPPTPTDIPHGGQAFNPFLRSEHWRVSGENMPEMVQEAEKLAEEYLTSAGKLFDGMNNHFGGSSPTKFPSTVTRTELSINTDDSNECFNPDVADATMFELVEGSDKGEAVDQEEKSVKVLEFSCEDDLKHKAAARTRGPAASTNHAARGPREGHSKSSKKTSEKNGVRESNSSSNILSRNAESSVMVHTGHSTENLQRALIDYANSSALGRRRRIRRPSCL
ncbi:hypothetical protein F5Y05DRAFT_400668 [Hypoxylon sp. FL0543]|nr:hypothetical protein F5Y05DRAFT_400668 [Hypoxylon sp. FL0543]